VDTLLYTFTLGMMAAVNPCGFPLLPAYLEMFVGSADGAGATNRAGAPGGAAVTAPTATATRALRAVTAAGWATVGFLVLFGALGLVAQLGWSQVVDHSASSARYVMVVVGVAMVAFGLLTLFRRNLKLNLPTPGSGTGLRRPAALAVFGFSYGVASIGCALPLFIGGVTAGFGRNGTMRGVSDLLTYGLGMGAVLGALAVAVAVAGPGAGRYLRRAGRVVPMVGGLLLVAVGTYLTWYWFTDIVTPGRSSWMERVVERLQLDVSNPIDQHAQLIGALLGAAVVLALLAGGLAGLRPETTASSRPAGARPPDRARPDEEARPTEVPVP
jgi:cytochrome c biogenesis protein CcdA